MKNIQLMIPAVFSVVLFAQGCSSTQEVEITGEVKAAAVSGPISIEFFEVAASEEETGASIKKIELTQPGQFSEKLEIEGDEVRVFALADADKDGACTEGEAWAEALAPVKEDGSVDPVSLELVVAAAGSE
jgi:hypothetical protein